MNLATIKTAVKIGRVAWTKFNDIREEKAREAYSALENAVEASGLDSVGRAAQERVERTLAELKPAKVVPSKKKRSKVGPALGILGLLAALGGAAFYLLRNVIEKEVPSEHPPRVEEFGADKVQGESTLVYSSTTPTQESDMVEEGVTERDEELLGSLAQQLEKLNEDEQEQE